MRRKIVWTIALVFCLVLTVVPQTRQAIFEKHLFAQFDTTAKAYVDDGLLRAATAFAAARTFNAVVSVIQESELQLEPGGVGVSVALGQALDPVNDLVERFSWVMLLSMTSLGIQKVLIEISPFVSVQILLSLALIFLLMGLWVPETLKSKVMKTGQILLFSALLIRLAVPTMAFLNHQVYAGFLDARYNESIASLQETSTQIEDEYQDMSGLKVTDVADGEEQGFLKKTKNWLSNGTRKLQSVLQLDTIKGLADSIIEKLVNLIVVFVLSTIVLPLLFLWGGWKLARLVFGEGFVTFAVEKIGGRIAAE